MSCLSIEQLVSLTLGELHESLACEQSATHEHVQDCPICAGAMRRVQEDLGRVALAHAWFHKNHLSARGRLLAALPAVDASQPRQARSHHFQGMRKVFSMPRIWISGAAAILVVVGIFFAWQAAGSPSALAQTAKALKEVKSYKCRITGREAGADGAKETEVGMFYWAAPGSYRMDSHEGGKPILVSIAIRGKPGWEIDHKYKTFQRTEPLYQSDSPLELFHELARFAGKADCELPEQKFRGKAACGFEIALNKIDPDREEGNLRVWPDPETKLPLRVEIDIPDDSVMILDDFAWNVATDRWFETEPPAKYQDETPAPATAEEQTTEIIKGLKAYAKYCGKYPPVTIVYGDVTCRRLFKSAGLSNPHKIAPREEQFTAEYAECSPARLGFAHMNTIQRHNPDAAYYGKTVGPDDKDKVLFRWKRTDGSYQVLYGDMHAATLTAEELRQREKR